MTALHPTIAKRFCSLCADAYQAWQLRRSMFDDNPGISRLMNSSQTGVALSAIRDVTGKFSLLLLLRLHDPAVTAKKATLTLDYVMTYGGWSKDVRKKLAAIHAKLEAFAKPLRSLRNQILAHNDLAALIANEPLGKFKKGDDIAYFNALQEFVDVVHDQAVGGPFPFPRVFKNHVKSFVASINP